MNKRDYYEVLGLSKDASESDVKSSFRKLSRKWHPDMQSGKSEAEKKEAEEKFKEIAEAYEVLSDKEKRANYDQFGFDGPHMSGGPSFGGFDMRDFMQRHGSMFGSMFGRNFGMHFGFGDDEDEYMYNNQEPDFNVPENGQNVQLAIELAFKESIHGCEKTFDLKLTKQCDCCHGTGIDNSEKPEKCPKCKGKGKVVQTTQQGFMISQVVTDCPECNGIGYKVKKCSKCNGAKRLQDVKHITVKIPAGIDNGQRLRVIGKGHCGVNGGQDGNLFILVSIKNQSVFERNGLNVKTRISIDPITATAGGIVKVATPYEMIDVDIPSGTRTGKQLVKYGKGIKANNTTGNLIIETTVEPFENLTAEQKKLMLELKSKMTASNFPLKDKYEQEAKRTI